MTAGEAVVAALTAALRGEPALAGADGLARPATPASLPRVEVELASIGDWSGQGFSGAEVRTRVTLRVARGQAARLPAMAAAAARAGIALAGDIGGWRVASAVMLGSELRDGANGVRSAAVEHRVRVAA